MPAGAHAVRIIASGAVAGDGRCFFVETGSNPANVLVQ